ncbi:MAG: MATE family efflux transporter [Peptoniphilaceae bacterium]|nr:MATE family efflux transporter [Peptoniphilaceae bacterium]MDD7383309.1 MATE family efflux transporter [Peptoniphilaceae bacterium]MDY3738320.1 MATE family efflux transporter [Peptoniphilaceae bacterium]
MKNSTEFITKGNINKVIFTLSIPLMFNSLIRTLYSLTDGIYVSRISSEDFAATSFSRPVIFLFISVGLGVGVASTALMAQSLGAKKDEKAKVYATYSVLISFVLGVIFSILGIIVTPFIIRWMGAKGSFFDKTYIYLVTSFSGIIFDMTYFGFQSILNSQGNTKAITIISAISSITNVILDPFFIFDKVLIFKGLNLGLMGAALATNVAKAFLVVMAIFVVKKESKIKLDFKNFKYDFKIVKQIFNLAVPISFGNSGEALGFTILNSFIQSYGTVTIAAFAIGNRLSDLVNQAAMGIGMSLTGITGQNIGAGNIKRTKAIFKRANFWITIFSMISALIILVFNNQLLSIFIKDNQETQLIKQASEYLAYTAGIIFFMGYFSSITGFFQGVGDTKITMIMSIARLWVLRLPLVRAFGKFSSLGSTGIWISMFISNFLIVLWGFIKYKQGKRMKKVLV